MDVNRAVKEIPQVCCEGDSSRASLQISSGKLLQLLPVQSKLAD